MLYLVKSQVQVIVTSPGKFGMMLCRQTFIICLFHVPTELLIQRLPGKHSQHAPSFGACLGCYEQLRQCFSLLKLFLAS